jgi:hypothetical protein
MGEFDDFIKGAEQEGTNILGEPVTISSYPNVMLMAVVNSLSIEMEMEEAGFSQSAEMTASIAQSDLDDNNLNNTKLVNAQLTRKNTNETFVIIPPIDKDTGGVTLMLQRIQARENIFNA